MTAATSLCVDLSPVWGWSSNSSNITYQLNSTTRAIAMEYTMPEAALITHIGITFAALTGTSPTYMAQLEGVAAGGGPDDTVLNDGGGNATGDFTTAGAEFLWVALAVDYQTSQGERLCVVVKNSATSPDPDGSNFVPAAYGANNYFNQGHPVPFTRDTTTWTRQSGRHPVLALKSATRAYGFPRTVEAEQTEGTTGNRLGVRFTLDAAYGDTFKIGMFDIAGTVFSAASGSTTIGIWDTAGTALQSDTIARNGHALVEAHFRHVFSAPVALDFGTTYIIGVQNTGDDIKMHYDEVDDNADLSAYPGGIGTYLANWTGAAWSYTDTRLPHVTMWMQDLTAPTGGGAASILGQLGVRGGMQ